MACDCGTPWTFLLFFSVAEDGTVNEKVKKFIRTFSRSLDSRFRHFNRVMSEVCLAGFNLRVVLPKQKSPDILQRLHTKHTFALLLNTADTIYILSGTMHTSLYRNISRLDQTSVEWRLAE